MRGSAQDQSIIVKLTQADRVALDLHCQKNATNKSQFIRSLLIAHNIIPAYYAEDV